MFQEVELTRVAGGVAEAVSDRVAVEEPLEIRLVHYPERHTPTESPLSITMRTPGHDLELAVGFLFAERIIESRDDVVETQQTENTLTVVLGPEVDFDARRLMRHFFTSSSCGVCGRAAIEPYRTRAVQDSLRWSASRIYELPDRLRDAQRLFADTAGVHAAALFGADLEVIREDVGRHNAVDKVVGRRVLDAAPLSDRLLMVSGRTSYDIVQKVVVAGIPIVAGVGAPSSLAVEMASALGITLIGFLSGKRFNVYSGAERIG